MFKFVWDKFSKTTLFEKMLLFVGLAISILGFYLINNMYLQEARVTWSLIQAAFLYLLLIFIVILTDSNESIKEELKIVIKEQSEETKYLREVANDQLEEIKLLRKQMKKK
ncbi:MAG: hypothetical protein R6U32_04440 [Candidatus Woesearchaeota archaeon]